MRTLENTGNDPTAPAEDRALPASSTSISRARQIDMPHPAMTSASPGPSRSDVVFRLAASTLGTWVVLVVATSPVSHQRPSWWTWFLGIGVVLAGGTLGGAFMTLNSYLRDRY